MGLFKDVFCTECGEKTKMLTRTHLCDDSYLCSKCAAIVPSYMKKTFEGKYTIEEYREFKEYAKSSEEEYGKIFHETHSFHDIHIDTENRLFYMEDYSVAEIADVLKIPVGTVKSRLNRGRKKLKAYLD